MRRKAQTRNRWRHNNAGRNGFRVRSLCLRPGMTNDEAIALHLTRFRVPHLICPSCQLAAPCPLAGRTRHTSPSPPSRAQQEGRIAIVTDVRTRGSDGREASATDDALALRTAKPCGPDAATLASSSWEASFLGMTVATKPVHRGELGISRKTIAQGMPDPFGEPVVTYLRAFHFRTRGCGCIAHPAFPAPSDPKEGTKSKPRADRQRDREAMPVGRASRVMGIARCLTSLNPLSPQRA
jgi:hypothetical protein